MKIYKAQYDSRNFMFEGFGKTKAEALAALNKALELHTKNRDLEEDWFYKDDIFVVEYQLGLPYCDHDLIIEKV
jgi:hypothetical protein